MRWPDSSAAARADLAACRALLRDGSRSFRAASLLLPRRVREPATALYAFCRLADDAVDLGNDGAAVARLRERLERAYAGRPHAIAADRAFARVAAAHGIPRDLPEALIEGFAWDAAGRRYETIEELHAYAARVAGAVGAMMALLMGVRSAATLARACDLGVAMQLTNIARDVGEDARAGRLYLPRRWMREAGIEPDAWLAAPAQSAALAAVVARLLRAADALYHRAGAGIAGLPRDCRPGIAAAALIYAEIGRAVAGAGHDALSRRASVPGGRKAWLLLRAAASPRWPDRGRDDPPLGAVGFLVEAAHATAASADTPPRRSLTQRAGWLLDLFERLERRDRRRRGMARLGAWGGAR